VNDIVGLVCEWYCGASY